MKRITKDDGYFILVWGKSANYDIINPTKNYVSMLEFPSQNALNLEAKTKGILVSSIDKVHPTYWSHMLSGYLLGVNTTLVKYLSVNNPELLL